MPERKGNLRKASVLPAILSVLAMAVYLGGCGGDDASQYEGVYTGHLSIADGNYPRFTMTVHGDDRATGTLEFQTLSPTSPILTVSLSGSVTTDRGDFRLTGTMTPISGPISTTGGNSNGGPPVLVTVDGRLPESVPGATFQVYLGEPGSGAFGGAWDDGSFP